MPEFLANWTLNNNTSYPFKISNWAFLPNKHLKFDYCYEREGINGSVDCQYVEKDDIYEGTYNQSPPKERGNIRYKISHDGNLLYVYGEWKSGKFKGYDFIVAKEEKAK
jgi:hypothetical protein